MTISDTSQRTVVVIVSPENLHDRETSTFAARINSLGLTAYGNTQEEASSRLKAMFASAVETRRTRGSLTRWLDGSGLEWYWLDEYQGDVPVEYARQSQQGVLHRDASRRRSSSNQTDWHHYDEWGVAA